MKKKKRNLELFHIPFLCILWVWQIICMLCSIFRHLNFFFVTTESSSQSFTRNWIYCLTFHRVMRSWIELLGWKNFQNSHLKLIVEIFTIFLHKSPHYRYEYFFSPPLALNVLPELFLFSSNSTVWAFY